MCNAKFMIQQKATLRPFHELQLIYLYIYIFIGADGVVQPGLFLAPFGKITLFWAFQHSCNYSKCLLLVRSSLSAHMLTFRPV